MSDATGFIVVDMANTGFRVVAIKDDRDDAITTAQALAEKDVGGIFGVFSKLGTARSVRSVEWKEATR